MELIKRTLSEISMPVLFVLALLILCSPILGEMQFALRYDRDAIMNGQWWRWLTGHLTHLEWIHWLGNVGALLLLSILAHDALTSWERIAVLFAGIVGASTGMWFFYPEITWYVGLSGTLHGFALAVAVAWIYQKDWMGYALLAGTLFKVISEALYGPWSEGVLVSGRVVWEAHFFGFWTVAAVLLFYRPKLTRQVTA